MAIRIIYFAIIVTQIGLFVCDLSLEDQNDPQTHHMASRIPYRNRRVINCSVYPTYEYISVFKVDYCKNQKRLSKDLNAFSRLCKLSEEERHAVSVVNFGKVMKDVCNQEGSLRNEYLEHLPCSNDVNTECMNEVHRDVRHVLEKHKTEWRQDMELNHTSTEVSKRGHRRRACESIQSCLMFAQTAFSDACGQQAELFARQIFNKTVLSQLNGKCDGHLSNYTNYRVLINSPTPEQDWLEKLILRSILLVLLCYLFGPTLIHWLRKLAKQLCLLRMDCRINDSIEISPLEESQI